jgi:Family of unknown function (DUF6627)
MEEFMYSSSYFKAISRILIFAMLHLCWLTSYGYAEMVSTESAVQIPDDRQRILDLLDRQEVIDELEKYGISKVEAVTRINSLSDEEITQIAGKLDELPAGGNPGVLVGMVVVLALYIPGVIFKAIGCIFIDCEYSIFKPWWDSSDSFASGPKPKWNTSRQEKATSELDQQVCRFDCGEAEKVCFESISEDEDANTGKLRCEEAKNACFQQCESN